MHSCLSIVLHQAEHQGLSSYLHQIQAAIHLQPGHSYSRSLLVKSWSSRTCPNCHESPRPYSLEANICFARPISRHRTVPHTSATDESRWRSRWTADSPRMEHGPGPMRLVTTLSRYVFCGITASLSSRRDHAVALGLAGLFSAGSLCFERWGFRASLAHTKLACV